MLSDQAAAEAAERKGGRLKIVDRARVYAIDIATVRWCRPPEVALDDIAPTCSICGKLGGILGEPEKLAGVGYVYRVTCPACEIEDEIEVPFRLAVGGTSAWWERALNERSHLRWWYYEAFKNAERDRSG